MPGRTFMLIADIGGYTRFMRLHRLSLAHSQEITGRLLEAVIDAAPELELVDVEGDAAFLCAFESEDTTVRGAPASSVSMYRAFHEKQQEIATRTMCPCEACSQVGMLKLKFVAHAGEVAEQKIRDRSKLVGLDVIAVHRMLKNSVPIPEYLLVTEAVFEQLEPAVRERATSITEDLEGLGETPLYFVDMDEIAGEITQPPDPSVAGRVLETAGLIGRGMPYLFGLKSRD